MQDMFTIPRLGAFANPLFLADGQSADSDPILTNSLATTSQTTVREYNSTLVPFPIPLSATTSQKAATESHSTQVILRSPLTATSSQSTAMEFIDTSVALPVMPEVIAPERPSSVGTVESTQLGQRGTFPCSRWSISQFDQKLHKATLLVLSLIEEHDRRKRLLSEQPGSVPSTGFTNHSQDERNSNTNPSLLRRLMPLPVNVIPKSNSNKSIHRQIKNYRDSEIRKSCNYVNMRRRYRSINSVSVPSWMEVRRQTTGIGNTQLDSISTLYVPLIGRNSRDKDASVMGGSEGGLPKTIENYLSDFLASESSLTPSQARWSRNILTLCSRRMKRTISPSLIAVSAIYLAVAVTRQDNYFFSHHSQVEVLTLAIDIAQRLLYFVELNTKKVNISVLDFNGEHLSKTAVKDVIDVCQVKLIHCKEESKINIKMPNCKGK